jgi:hypothetical protein
MSTRANILIKDQYGDKLFFYRHSDGYPEGTLTTLKMFIQLVKNGKIRNNVGQCAGWLVIIGAIEYQTVNPELFNRSEFDKFSNDFDLNKKDGFMGWKVGSYEPTTGLHGDIEYLYEIDLEKCAIKVYSADNWGDKLKKKLIETINV